MTGFIRNSALAVLAWNLSSLVTLAQMAVAREVIPTWYNATLGIVAAPLLALWAWVRSLGEVLMDLIHLG